MTGFLDVLKNPEFNNDLAMAMEAGGRMAFSLNQIDYGGQLKASADFAASQLRGQAGDAIASAQRAAFNEQRRARYVASDILAKAAASGGGASDPTVINLIAQTAAEGSYRQQVALYEGDARARLLRMQADAKEFEGASQQAAAKRSGFGQMFGAASTLLKGYEKDSSLLERFGRGGPNLPRDIKTWEGY